MVDEEWQRIYKFSPSGEFILAFGWGVLNGAEELQTCTEATGCRRGLRGSESGQFNFPTAIAVEQSTGDVYVADSANHRVQKFALNSTTDEYEFLLMFGGQVNKTAVETAGRESEEDVCPAPAHPADVCQAGTEGNEPGQIGKWRFNSAGYLAIGGPGGNVYVGDFGRLDVFAPSGAFVEQVSLPGTGQLAALTIDTDPASLAFGDLYTLTPSVPGTNEVQELEVTCVAPATYRLKFEGEETAALNCENSRSEAEIQAALEALPKIGAGNVSVSSCSCGNEFYSVEFRGPLSATNVPQLEGSAGVSVETRVQGVPGTPGVLTKRKPSGEAIETLDSSAPFGNPTALALDSASGVLFVYDQYEPAFNPRASLLRYSPIGALAQAFDPEIGQSVNVNGMAFSPHTNQLYLTSGGGWIVAPPPLGPLVKPGTVTATPQPRGHASFAATINPEGQETSCVLEYGTTTSYGESAPCEPAGLGEGFRYVNVTPHLEHLTPGATYHWRVVATNSTGEAASEDQEFEETPAAILDGPWANEVASTSAYLEARINPLGAPGGTTYHLEYGTTTGYGNEFTGQLGEGASPVLISHHLGGLSPSTSYHFRLVTVSSVGTVTGGDHTFTTQGVAANLALPDNRAWEMVSPPEKHGGGIEIQEGIAVIQAAADGEALTYNASSPITETAQTGGNFDQVLSARAAAGWSSREIRPSKKLPEAGAEASELGTATGVTSVELFSPDLGKALIEPSRLVGPLSPEATERTLYIYDAQASSYVPLVTPANVPPGTEFGGAGVTTLMHFLSATPDLSHVLFQTPIALTPEAHQGPPSCSLIVCPYNLYEWAGGQLKDVGILPNGEPAAPAYLGQEENANTTRVQHTISNDGRWIVWSTAQGTGTERPRLYLRDVTKPTSIELGGIGSTFQDMTPDGSRVFFIRLGELHSFDTATETATIATAHMTPAGAGAEVQAVIGSSEDGRAVYLVARGVLGGEQQNVAGERAVAGQPNLYLLRESGGAWTPTYIATLSPADEHSWTAYVDSIAPTLTPSMVTSHLSPDGRWLAFMSERPLTGYDNHDAASGQRDEEVYLYDAQAGRLLCASCNPTGARPHGVLEPTVGTTSALPFDPGAAWVGHWLGASMPGWRSNNSLAHAGGLQLYQPRELSDSGRLFFQSADALVPQDTNGTQDVYEYEPPGVGSCTESDPTYSPASGGCVSLISSGTSAQESVFYDASESGKDVFFATTSQLAPQDGDRETDVYDARSPHFPGEAVGFPLPPRPPACEGDACQPAVAAPNDETPSSSTYHGPGNEHPARKRKRHRRHHRAKHHRRARSNRGGRK